MIMVLAEILALFHGNVYIPKRLSYARAIMLIISGSTEFNVQSRP